MKPQLSPPAYGQSVQTATDHLAKHPLFAPLLQQVQSKSRLEHALNEQLPPALRGHIRIGNNDEHVQTILTDSPTLASRLRQLLPRLLRTTQTLQPQITELVLKVSPINEAPQQEPIKESPISAYGLDTLRKLKADLSSPTKHQTGRAKG